MAHLNCNQLEKVIEAGHTLFEFIEERDFAYQILRKFINCGMKKYSDFEKELEELKESVESWIDYDNNKKEEIRKYIDDIKSFRDDDLLGHLTLLFLLSWNMNRFKGCRNFDKESLKAYGNYLNSKLKDLYFEYRERFKDKDIRSISWEEIEKFLEELNKILKQRINNSCFQTRGNRQDEWVGAIKVGSVFFPKVIIPVDNPIAEALCFKYPKEGFSSEIYQKFWEKIKEIVSRCPNLVDKLKEIDELFYVLFSLREKIKFRIQEKLIRREKEKISKELRKKRFIENLLRCYKNKIKKVEENHNKIMLVLDKGELPRIIDARLRVGLHPLRGALPPRGGSRSPYSCLSRHTAG